MYGDLDNRNNSFLWKCSFHTSSNITTSDVDPQKIALRVRAVLRFGSATATLQYRINYMTFKMYKLRINTDRYCKRLDPDHQ